MPVPVLSAQDLDEKFYSLIEQVKPDLFLEVGAYNAGTSDHVKKLVPECRTVAFEGNPDNHRKFNGTHKQNIEYLNLAVSNYAGKISIGGGTGAKNHSILDRVNKGSGRSFLVNAETLDNMFGEEYTNIVMWIDAEGAGYEVLLGAKSLLEKTRFLKIEVEMKQFWKDQVLDQEIIEFLENLGFTYSYRDQEYPQQYNIIFTKGEI